MTGEPMHTTSNERNGARRPNYQLSSESKVSSTLHCQLCSTRYTLLHMNYSKSTPAIKVATMKIQRIFHYEGKPSSCATTKSTLRCQQR